MGQLEKYGLYVLCLVIFLILGVTIWGKPASATKQAPGDSLAMRADALGVRPSNSMTQGRRASSDGTILDLDDLLSSGARPPNPVSRSVPKEAPTESGAVSRGPGVKAAAPVKVAAEPVAKTRKYKVRSGDMLGSIALKQLGSTRFIGRIEALNPGLKEKHLQIGKEILLPVLDGRVAKLASSSASYRMYTIAPKDSFERIARVELGDKKRVKELMQLNPNMDPRRLMPGKTIRLPLK